MEQGTRSRLIAGAMLIIVGLTLFLMQRFEELGQSVALTALGGLFIAGYLYTRAYAFLVPGGILVGLGLGSFGERYFYVFSDLSNIGLGVGFVLIYLIALLYQRRSHWWPLIPGTVLILLGLRTWGKVWRFLLDDGWPFILVIIGFLMILGTVGRSRKAKRKS
jgi:hypothetical protein